MTISYSDLLILGDQKIILDVRSPSEYNHAHIPGAVSLPLFDDQERAHVGTTYKKISREMAIKIGLDYFGPKMRKMVEDVEHLVSHKDQTIVLHCWRGGMRSATVAWLLRLYGFNVLVLDGGYKSFRQWVLNNLSKDYNFYLIGGKTGSGKTMILHELAARGHTIIDFEGLASHKGSAFGNIGMPDQPSQEMFENIVSLEVYHKSRSNQVIWVEDESQRIGAINIPGDLYKIMSKSPVFFLEIPFEQRLKYIISEYGKLDRTMLVNATQRIQRRLGGLEANNTINYLMDGDIETAFSILLKYYDKFYLRSLGKKNHSPDQVQFIACDSVDAKVNAKKLLMHTSKLQSK